jgi:thiol-disulfide isomerase/thioredoxin
MSQTKKFIVITLLIIVLVIVLGVFANKPKSIGKYGPFAQCLTDSGAKFYGAFWCPHCQAQKSMFGGAKTLLPYVECAYTGKIGAEKAKEILAQYNTGTYTGVYKESLDKAKEAGQLAKWIPQTEMCEENGVKGYPTWVFKDGSRLTGEVKFETLAEKTQCILPQ